MAKIGFGLGPEFGRAREIRERGLGVNTDTKNNNEG